MFSTIITTVKQGLLGGLGVEAIAGFSCAGKLSSLLLSLIHISEPTRPY